MAVDSVWMYVHWGLLNWMVVHRSIGILAQIVELVLMFVQMRRYYWVESINFNYHVQTITAEGN